MVVRLQQQLVVSQPAMVVRLQQQQLVVSQPAMVVSLQQGAVGLLAWLVE